MMGRKLFKEVDEPLASNITSTDSSNGITERESSWKGTIEGYLFFPNGVTQGSGHSITYSNGIKISNWKGKFTTESGDNISFIGKDVSRGSKFFVLRTFFTDVPKLKKEMDGLICYLDGNFNAENNTFVCNGYEMV
jgi:hypothetical protein